MRLAVALSALFLAACAHKVNPIELQQRIDHMDRAVIQGQQDPQVALNDYRMLAKKYPKEPVAVAAYAEALRRVGQAKDSAEVLRPMIKGKNVQDLPDPVFMAYMRLLLGQGFFVDVQDRVQQRMAAVPTPDPQLYNLLGVALAGQGKRADAEKAFTQALVGWNGRPGVVEENLAKLKTSKE